MSLQWLVPETIGFFRGPATVGLIKGNTGWIFIDSGVDASVPKKILKSLREALNDNGIRVSAVINTHAHADHCGGNKWLQANQETLIFASEGERPYIENPYLEPHYLFSAEGPKALKGKFFQAEMSVVNHVVHFENSSLDQRIAGDKTSVMVDGLSLTLVALPGHSKDMIGVITTQGYCFCGDLLFTPMILEKHPLLFEHDYGAYLASLEWMGQQNFKGCILTHGGFFEETDPLVMAVKNRLVSNFELVMAILASAEALDNEGAGLNEVTIHEQMASTLGLEEDFGAWHLNHGVLRSYLSYGLSQNLIKWEKGLYQRL